MYSSKPVPFALTETYLLPTSLVLVTAKRTWAASGAWETWEAELAYRRARPQQDPGDESDARPTAAILCELGRAYPSRSRKLTCFRLRWFW
ncbi:hypothetical protein [Corynebacterium stationis]|uniref:hypothetical protein n=1 Tax=Corynebacterium stationis TaxID=1705 RepID=UPI0012EBFEBA|nr:hypothetical protein [Corynebacterium stationis]